MSEPHASVVGGGLAGCEAACQLARRGVAVTLYEAKPAAFTPAHRDPSLAELVCSNSLRADRPPTAPALLKAELRHVGAALLAHAEAHRVPAGMALAVNRADFAAAVTRALEAEPRITIRRGAALSAPPGGPCILATGPLTEGGLAEWLAARTGADHLHFYDAIAPIVSCEGLDRSIIFAGSRRAPEETDYLNIPLDADAYRALVEALRSAEQARAHDFESAVHFDACQPIEQLAERGQDALAFGPFRPVGLTDPRTGRWPHAVIQLRREDAAGTAFNLVGCQTRMTQAAQREVFRSLPGMADVEFLRYGSVHRNTYVDGPRALAADLSLRAEPEVFLAGQLTGGEGYVEAMATGFLAAHFLAARLAGQPVSPPPVTSALGALWAYVTGEHEAARDPFEPSHFHYGLVPPSPGKGGKRARRERHFKRGLADLQAWWAEQGI